MLHAACSIHYGSLYLCSGIIIINNQAHLFLSSPSIIFWSQPISLANSILTHTPKRQMWETGLDPMQAQLKLTFLQTTVWQQCGYSTFILKIYAKNSYHFQSPYWNVYFLPDSKVMAPVCKSDLSPRCLQENKLLQILLLTSVIMNNKISEVCSINEEPEM